MKRRFLAAALCLCMALIIMSTTAFAAAGEHNADAAAAGSVTCELINANTNRYAIYANGTPLYFKGTGSGYGYTQIYVDANRNGYDSSDVELTSSDLPGITYAKGWGFYIGNSIVYGGSKDGNVAFDTYMTFAGASDAANINTIYGGNCSGTLTGNSTINIAGSNVYWRVFGGNNSGTFNGNTNITISGGAVNSVFGGNDNSGKVTGNTYITIKGNANVNGWVYGGGAGVNDNVITEVVGSTNITINGGSLARNIYGGGGWRGSKAGSANITLNGGAISGDIYGGGEEAGTVGDVSITVNMPAGNNNVDISSIYGGGAGFGSTNATVTGNVSIELKSGVIGNIFGSGGGNIYSDGSKQTSTVSGAVTVTLSGGSAQSVYAANTLTGQNDGVVISGDFSVTADGGQILTSCYLGNSRDGTQAMKNVSLTLKGQTAQSCQVQLLEPVSESFTVLIEDQFQALSLDADVLKAAKASSLTYVNCGTAAGTWAAYDNSGALSQKGTNPRATFNELRGNTFDSVNLINCYLDYDGTTYYGQSSALSTMADVLVLDGGILRCQLVNTTLPVIQLKHEPTILSSTISSTEFLRFAAVSGTARLAVIGNDGTTAADSFAGISNYGKVIANAPVGTAAAAFTYPSLDTSKYALASELRDGKQVWFVLPLSACRCSLVGATLESRNAVITEGSSSASMTLRDILDGSTERSQDCPIPGHKEQSVQTTYQVVPDGTTATGAVITGGNRLTVTSAGQVKIHVTDTLNGKSEEYDSVIAFTKEPAQTSYTFNKSSSSGITLKIAGDMLSADKRKTVVYQDPGVIGNIGGENWEASYIDGVLTVTIQPSYLRTLDVGVYDRFVLSYELADGAGQGAFHFSVTITDKIVPTGEPTLSKESITYGEKLSAITLSGNMNGVAGVFTWDNGDAAPGAGSYDAAWTFVPYETDAYVTANGMTTITVNKATPTGAPSHTPITGAGHTLEDTALSVGTITPEGTIHWNDSVSTSVLANTSYWWTFTPNDSTNYNNLTGIITPYIVHGGDSATTYYTITAGAGEGGSISPDGSVSVQQGQDMTFNITSEDGYVVSDVLVDGASVKNELAGGSYTFENVTKAHTINVTFIEEGDTNLFTDVKGGDWFYDDVAYVYENKLMNGTGESTFSPSADTTRGMIVTILYRLEGEPAVSGACPFDDVKSGSYYEKAITWAAANAIVDGYGNGRFGPDDSVTREQMAAILYRYADFKGYDVTAAADLSKFSDNGKISGYAVSAMAWANAEGLVNGVGDNLLDPVGTATRAHTAAILHRFCENISK